MDVERWIRQAKAGDAEAFNRLAATFQDLLFHVALQHSSGNDDDALDACQDALLSAWNAMPRFEGDARGFRAWLVRIVVNACRDRVRYDKRRPTQPIEFEDDGETRALPLPDPGQSPQEYAENQDLGALLEWALAQLSEDHRSIIVLDHAGFDYAQMADILGVEVGTIKSRLSRARAQVRRILKGEAAAAPTPGRSARLGEGIAEAERGSSDSHSVAAHAPSNDGRLPVQSGLDPPAGHSTEARPEPGSEASRSSDIQDST